MLPSRPLTRAYFRAAVVGKTFGHRALVNGPASSLGPKVPSAKGTGPILLWAVDDRAAPASTASAPAAGASSGVASSKAPSAQPGAWAGKGAELHGTTPARLSAVATAQKWLMNAEVASECVEHRYA